MTLKIASVTAGAALLALVLALFGRDVEAWAWHRYGWGVS